MQWLPGASCTAVLCSHLWQAASVLDGVAVGHKAEGSRNAAWIQPLWAKTRWGEVWWEVEGNSQVAPDWETMGRWGSRGDKLHSFKKLGGKGGRTLAVKEAIARLGCGWLNWASPEHALHWDECAGREQVRMWEVGKTVSLLSYQASLNYK